MKSTYYSLGILALAGGFLAGAFRLFPLTEPDAILELQNASLTAFQPTGATAKQDVRPQVGQRGVLIDGSLRAGDAFGMVCAGNPYGGHCPTSRQLGVIDLPTGSYVCNDVDMDLPSAGFHWRVVRTYNAVQLDSGGSHRDSNGLQGRNWFQGSQPELLFYDADGNSGTEQAGDYVYLVYGADRFIEFKRVADNDNNFRATDGAAGVIYHAKDSSSEPDLYKFTDQNGQQFWFFGWDGDAGSAQGELWKVLDTAGETESSSPACNTAFIGDQTTASTAITNGYSSGKISKAYDAAGRRFSYTYDGNNRLTQVKAETKTGGTWASPTGVATVGQVDYSYYDGTTSYGNAGDLELVKITIPQTDSGVNVVKRKYYRYWKGTFNSSTNPGHDYAIQLILGFEGSRNYDWSSDGDIDDADLRAASTSTLKPYAEAYFEYDSSYRINKSWTDGGCNCSGGTGNGEYDFTYDLNGSYSDGTGYDEDIWKWRTVVERPDATYVTQYFDETNAPTHRVVTDIVPTSTSPAPKIWVTWVDRNSKGVVVETSTPANITAYTHSSASFTRSSSAGLIYTYSLVASGNSTEGFVTDLKSKVGTSGTAYLDHTWSFTHNDYLVDSGQTKSTVVRPIVASDREYTQDITSGTTGSNLWSYSYTWHATTGRLELCRKKLTVTQPAVSSGNNGSGSSETTANFLYKDQTLGWESSANGYITYHEYTNGQQTKLIEDADTTQTGADQDFNGITIPSGFSSSGTPLHHKTTFTFDAQGRLSTKTVDSYTPATYYSGLADGRQVVLQFTHSVAGSPTTYYGPVGYRVINHTERTEFDGVIALSGNSSTSALTSYIDETKSDPLQAVGVGTICRMSTSIFSDAGTQLSESRAYFTIPGSGVGTVGTNYDSTLFGFDDSGRRWRVKEASGTIRRTVFDTLGRATQNWIGTNDHSFSGGESSGTDNMVKTNSTDFDSGGDKGNSYVTTRTAFIQDSTTGQRVTTFTNDDRGRPIVVANPTTPHGLNKFDHMGRKAAAGLYSSTSGLTSSSDPTSVTTNRVALTETTYDERDLVCRTTRHKITASSGADADTLLTDNWYDGDQRLVKRDGPQLEKWFYDRLNRITNHFTLANDDDATYSATKTVTGDKLLEEEQTVYDTSDGKPILRALIQRNHDDYGAGSTTGALDTNADGVALKYTSTDLKGRIQITAIWNSLQGVTDEVQYGNYGGSTFDRTGLSIPSRSDTALRTTYTWDTDGTLLTIEDPLSHKTKYLYDQLGRKTSEIRNWNGTNTTPTDPDVNVTTSWAYASGLMTSMTANLPSGQTSQVTTYTYGTVKGTSAGQSNIATGHLLQKTTYPDSSSDNVQFAYNAQGQENWKQDQAGNIFQTDYDDSGRKQHYRVSTLATGFDSAVLRISNTYTNLGQIQLVTQYDNATVGSGSVVNEVKFTYDDWGNVSQYQEDRDSAVGATGSVNDYSVSYTYAKNTSGRNTIRRTGATLPSGKTITYDFVSLNGKLDSDASRLTRLKDNTVELVAYDYLGVGNVIGTTHNQSSVFRKLNSLSVVGSYPELDRFNRPTTARWTKDLTTDKDFYYANITYDRNSNITLINYSNEHHGFDTQYTLDGLDRVTEAKEGTWNGSSITSTTRDQQWTLTHTGNWKREKLDLNGDGDFVDAGEHDDSRTHNDVNELTAQDTDSNGSNNYTLSYDAAGNLTDDNQSYKYVYDPFYRLRKINNQSNALVEELTYDGLGHQIGSHYDNDRAAADGVPDGTVDSHDHWYYTAYDENWRPLSTFRDSDTSPKEEFILHQAGDDGLGGASYINSVVCRYKDANTAWTSASDGTLEQVYYYVENWRHDVVAILDESGKMVEWVKYSAYGVPFGLPAGDADSNGTCDSTDANQIQTWINGSSYDIRGDLDLDSDVDSTDKTLALDSSHQKSLGFSILSGVGNRVTSCGYSSDPIAASIMHIQHRALSSRLGDWLSRDPIEFDRKNLYQYVGGRPLIFVDPEGLAAGKCPECPANCTLVSDPSNPPKSNGCGSDNGIKFPNTLAGANVKEACDNHDICYGTCGADKKKCDEQFGQDLKTACSYNLVWIGISPPDYSTRLRMSISYEACMAMGKAYKAAVKCFGDDAFCTAQINACLCCCTVEVWEVGFEPGVSQKLTFSYCMKPTDGRKKKK